MTSIILVKFPAETFPTVGHYVFHVEQWQALHP